MAVGDDPPGPTRERHARPAGPGNVRSAEARILAGARACQSSCLEKRAVARRPKSRACAMFPSSFPHKAAASRGEVSPATDDGAQGIEARSTAQRPCTS